MITAIQYTLEEYKDIRRRAVDNLLRLNTIVIGLALTEAVRKTLIETSVDGRIAFQINWQLLYPLSMLISTLVCFYHGANRYLDNTYIFDKTNQKKGSAIVDLFVFFMEAALFYLMALSLADGHTFIFWFLMLMLLDTIWLVAVYFKTNEIIFNQVKPWMIVNFFTFLIMGFIHWLIDHPNKVYFLFGLGILRTVIDYKSNWKFYFPDPIKETSESK